MMLIQEVSALELASQQSLKPRDSCLYKGASMVSMSFLPGYHLVVFGPAIDMLFPFLQRSLQVSL